MTTDLEKLENLTERLNQPRGNWDWDIVKDELLWSTSIFQIFGLTPKTFGGTYEAFLDSVHQEDRRKVKAAVDAALDPERSVSYSIDHRIVLPDGSERTVHEEAEVFFDHKGNAIRMTGTVQDITQFGQNSEQEWRKSMVWEVREVRKDVKTLIADVAGLKVKAGVWGLAGGAIPVIIMVVFMLLKGKL